MESEQVLERPAPAGRAARLAPWALLGAATLGLYAPYLGSRFVSGNGDRDALAYLVVLADAVEQARQGYFPVYVGQSALRPNGGLYPQAQAPGFTLLAAALDALTAHALPATALLNLLLVLTALAGAGSMLACLRALRAGSAWAAAALAFGYVACPGVLGLLVRLDMVTSFLALPWLPWLWLGLVKALQGETVRGGLLAGLSLAALWTVHAPVALWATTAAGLAGLVGAALARRGLRAALLAGLVFAACGAWTFATVFTLTGGRAGNVGLDASATGLAPQFVERVLTVQRGDAAGALLPVGWVRGHPFNGWPEASAEVASLPVAWRADATLPYLQLGYLSWAALGLALAAAARAGRRRRAPALVALVAGAALLVLFLFPIPGLTRTLWSLLPGVYDITKWWPMQRLYLVLASLAAPAGWLAWSGTCGAATKPLGRWPALALGLLVAWSAHEAWKFETFALSRRSEAPWLARAENLPLRVKDLQMSAPEPLPEYPDPDLHLRRVDVGGSVLADNLARVAEDCLVRGEELRPAAGTPASVRLALAPGERRALCLAGPAPGGTALLQVSGAELYRHLRLTPSSTGAAQRLLPLFSTAVFRAPLVVTVATPARQALAIEGLRWLRYDPAELPIRVESWLPFRARLDAPEAGTFLQTPRQLVPGYLARVNGRAVAPVALRPGGPLALPLERGQNLVELEYRGPDRLRAAFALSALCWLVSLAALWRARGPAPAAG